MGRRGLIAAVAIVAVLAALAWWRTGPPGRAPPHAPEEPAGPAYGGAEPEAPAEPVATVRVVFGSVVDAATGSPIEGASVSVIPSGVEGSTDAQGRFEIPGWHGTLLRCAVRAPGVGAALGPWLPFDDGDRLDAGTIRIRTSSRLAGRVVDPSGAAVAGADVRLEREGPTSEEWEALLDEFGFQVTEDDGRFSFEGLDDGFFRLSVSVYDPTSDDESRRTLEHVRAGREEIVLVVPFARKSLRGTISLSVMIPDGRPLPSGRLQVSAGGSWESTPVRAGNATVEIDGSGPALASVVAPTDENGTPLPYLPAFLPDIAPREEPYVVVLKPGGTIEGLVTTLDGMPLGANVSFLPSRLDAEDFPRNHLHDIGSPCAADGRFRSPGLPPGEYHVCASYGGYVGARPSVVARTGAKDVRIEMRRSGRIRLRVVAPEGEILGGGSFTLLAPPGYVAGGTSTVSVGRNSKAPSFETDFDGLREGEVYRIRGSVSGRGFGRYAPFEIDAVAGDGDPVEVIVRPGRMLVGRVIRGDGRPVAAAEVRVRVPLPAGEDENVHWSTDQGQSYTTSALDGRFELRGVPAGSFWLSCAATGLAQPEGPLAVGVNDREIEIRLVPAAEISGRVVGEGPLDFRIEWIPVDLAGEAAATPREPGDAGADGFFAIKGLPPGRLRLDGSRPWASDDDRYVEAEAVEAGATDLRLKVIQGCRIEGAVRDRDGRPMHMATVFVEAPWGRRRATTDHEGRFVLHALPAGRHVVRLRTAHGLGEPVPADAPGPAVHLTR